MKLPSERIEEILCKIMDEYTHPDDNDWNHERVNAVIAYLDETHQEPKNHSHPQNTNCTACEPVTKKENFEVRIGMLRQWLNEDIITDPKKMVTNEEIKYWLDIK